MGASAWIMAAPANPKASVARNSRVGRASGMSSPSMTADTRANVTPSRANQPVVSDVGAWGSMPSTGTRPWVGRMPNRPQKLAGTRTDPPVSVPSAVSHSPDATADAEPELDPPGTRSGAAGLSGVPSNRFSPRIPSEISSVTVLPTNAAPASSSVCTAQAWRVGMACASAQSGLPAPVGCPAMSNRSLAAKVRSCSGPPGAPAMCTRGPGRKGSVEDGFMTGTVQGGRRLCKRDYGNPNPPAAPVVALDGVHWRRSGQATLKPA